MRTVVTHQNHARYRRWLEDVLAGDEAHGLSDLVLSGILVL